MTEQTRPVLGPGPEFDRIRAVAAALGDVARGLGDDCAPIDFAAGVPLVSTDTSVEEVHFRRAWLSDEEIGWRATAAALSDLAAMGAVPAGLVAAVTMPTDLGESVLVAFMRGVGEAASAVGAAVLGGDLSRGPCCALTITVFGTAVKPVLRSGARLGDQLWVTGQLGGPRAALEALQRGLVPPADLRARFARPVPRIAAGRALAALGATAMIDISDGLGADAAHLAAASAVELRIALELLPLMAGLPAADTTTFAAGSGEEYELLAALPCETAPEAVQQLADALGLTVTLIGTVAEGGPGVRLLSHGVPVTVAGFDHFRDVGPSR
jgi:thiamine-monophosphate kinase